MSEAKRIAIWTFAGALLIALIGWFIAVFTPEIRAYYQLDKTESFVASKAQQMEQQNTESGVLARSRNSESEELVSPGQTSISITPARIEGKANPHGKWAGTWYSGDIVYRADVELIEDSGKVRGRIRWVLEKTPNPSRANKIGSAATEYVKGNYNEKSKTLNLFGERKDDPNEIIILDKYKLDFDSDGQTLDGFSYGGKNKATFRLARL